MSLIIGTHGVTQAPMNLGINVRFSQLTIVYNHLQRFYSAYYIQKNNIHFSSAAVKKPVAKSSSKRTRTISSDEGDTQEELKPVKKKQMKQGSILDMMSKCEFLIKQIIFYNFFRQKEGGF